MASQFLPDEKPPGKFSGNVEQKLASRIAPLSLDVRNMGKDTRQKLKSLRNDSRGSYGEIVGF
jgi:hypothetical protein